jgi:hydrogenase/urease accessory protein HupE
VRGTAAVAATFVRAGIEHILIGPDHVLFIVALVILGGSLARLLTIVTAFTLGHSVTLSLAVTGLASVPAVMVEPAIALSIVVAGLDNLLAADGRVRRDVRPLAAACFGLVHGFGFASVLREFGVPASAIGVSLLSFNVGVEIGQLAIVAGVLAMVAGLRRQSSAAADRVAFAASALIVIAGAWWFVQRI